MGSKHEKRHVNASAFIATGNPENQPVLPDQYSYIKFKMSIEDIEDIQVPIPHTERATKHAVASLDLEPGEVAHSYQEGGSNAQTEDHFLPVRASSHSNNFTQKGTKMIYIKTWGCSHNNSDSEYFAGKFPRFHRQSIRNVGRERVQARPMRCRKE
jgi:hypothetical protein